jgi:ABC-type Fe3+ transport system permease subunit
MIAQRLLVEEEYHVTRSRAARGAAERRRARTKRMRYAMTVRIAAIVGTLTACVVVYLALMGNVERINYELARADRERAVLVEKSTQLDDTLARLRSRERLARVAASLGMHESQTFVSISLPADRPKPEPGGLAFLAKLR